MKMQVRSRRVHRVVRRLACVMAASTVTLATVSSFAQTFGRDARSRRESPQHFAVELRGGPYYPNIDAEFGGGATAPFRAIFGSDARVLMQLEFDWQIVRIPPVMSLGVGASIGFTTIQSRAPITDMMTGDPSTWVRSAENTGLQVMPFTLVAVARFDGAARNIRWWPIVPYAKLGLAYTPWWVTNGTGIAHDQRTSPAADAIGASFGFHMAIGLALSLEIFEPHVQRQFDETAGVNHSYVFFELYNTSMLPTSLAGSPQLNLSLLAWNAGIALEF